MVLSALIPILKRGPLKVVIVALTDGEEIEVAPRLADANPVLTTEPCCISAAVTVYEPVQVLVPLGKRFD